MGGDDWGFLAQANNPSDAYDLFITRLLEYWKKAFPLELCKYSDKKFGGDSAWVTEEIVQRGRALRDLFNQVRRSNNADLKNKYKTLIKQHKHNIRDAKKRLNDLRYSNATNKSKCAWGIINGEVCLGKGRSYLSSFTDENSNGLGGSQAAAEAFNNFFLDSVQAEADKLKPSAKSNLRLNCFSMFLRPTDQDEIAQIILAVSRKDAAGADGIPCSLLSKVVDIVSPVLSWLINRSFSEGVFPAALRTSIVKPIHKKKDLDRIDNYRGISLLPAF